MIIHLENKNENHRKCKFITTKLATMKKIIKSDAKDLKKLEPSQTAGENLK